MRVAWEEWELEEAIWGWDVERIPQSIVQEEGSRRTREGRTRKGSQREEERDAASSVIPRL